MESPKDGSGNVFGLKFVKPDPSKVIVLDRVIPDTEPDYCIHGRTRCIHCQQWCWLGAGTIKVVSDGTASPICRQCAAEVIKPGGFIGNVHDHRRADGPHQ